MSNLEKNIRLVNEAIQKGKIDYNENRNSPFYIGLPPRPSCVDAAEEIIKTLSENNNIKLIDDEDYEIYENLENLVPEKDKDIVIKSKKIIVTHWNRLGNMFK